MASAHVDFAPPGPTYCDNLLSGFLLLPSALIVNHLLHFIYLRDAYLWSRVLLCEHLQPITVCALSSWSPDVQLSREKLDIVEFPASLVLVFVCTDLTRIISMLFFECTRLGPVRFHSLIPDRMVKSETVKSFVWRLDQ